MKQILEIGKDSLRLGGEPFLLVSGSLHYFRILPGDWKRRLKLAKDFGLTAIQTYVPWNAHEPRPGEFDFSGMLDLAGYLKAADEVGLKVLLRPSPYICSEWDFGGLPWWLLRDHPRIALRRTDPDFLAALKAYYQRLCREFVPYLSTNGGPVIMVAVENEYGSYGNDRDYLRFNADLLRENGVDVPLYTADGYSDRHLKYGNLPEFWAGVDYRIESAEAIAALRRYQPGRPPLLCEYWSGRAIHWEEEFHYRDVPPIAAAFREALDLGGMLNFYMFGGGTNFGLMNGANIHTRPGTNDEYYNPITTSYDVDALLSENGTPTAKYYACRRELDDFLGKPVRPDNDEPVPETQFVAGIRLTRCASLAENLDVLTAGIRKAARPLTMEEMGQGYGFLLYSAELPAGREIDEQLFLDGLHDRAQVYLDGEYIGTLYRNQGPSDAEIPGPLPKEPFLPVRVPAAGGRLDILVENMGRVCYGMRLGEEKGITGPVRLGQNCLSRFTIRSLPLENLDKIRWTGTEPVRNHPGFWQGTFHAKAGVDTWLHTVGWGKGIAWINGFCLGRYWETGPQMALYLPGALLKDTGNVLELFELHHPSEGRTIELIDHPVLDGALQPSRA